MVCCKVAKNWRLVFRKNLENPPHCHVPLMAWISKRSEAIESFDNDVFFDIEAKRTCSTVEKIISKRSEHVYIEEFEYRSEANRFDSDFVFKKSKKSELSFFFKTKGKKRKGSLVNYRSFAITSRNPLH